MRFWDASAVVPLLVRDAFTVTAQQLWQAGDAMTVWWGTRVECASALGRRERGRMMDAAPIAQARQRLRALAEGWIEVEPVERVREDAERLLRVHALRAADALQLAAAWTACERQPLRLEFVTFDECLALAAQREGFRLCGWETI